MPSATLLNSKCLIFFLMIKIFSPIVLWLILLPNFTIVVGLTQKRYSVLSVPGQQCPDRLTIGGGGWGGVESMNVMDSQGGRDKRMSDRVAVISFGLQY